MCLRKDSKAGAEGDEVREDHGSVQRHSKDFGFEVGCDGSRWKVMSRAEHMT